MKYEWLKAQSEYRKTVVCGLTKKEIAIAVPTAAAALTVFFLTRSVFGSGIATYAAILAAMPGAVKLMPGHNGMSAARYIRKKMFPRKGNVYVYRSLDRPAEAEKGRKEKNEKD